MIAKYLDEKKRWMSELAFKRSDSYLSFYESLFSMVIITLLT